MVVVIRTINMFPKRKVGPFVLVPEHLISLPGDLTGKNIKDFIVYKIIQNY
jgi:hypothetical protein